MFTPQELEKIPIELEKLFSQLEMEIMQDIIRRMKINSNEITRTADWQIYRLNQLGQSKRSIKKYLEKTLELSKKEINHIYKSVIRSGYAEDELLYKSTGKPFIKFEDNEELQQLISAIKEQTNEELYNITQSTGFIKNVNGQNVFTPLTQYYQETLDNAVNGVLNGAFDHNTVIKKTVQEMTKSGLRSVDYGSGRSYRIDSAARMAIMTGVNQVASKISDSNAKELDTEYFEVSAHGTARPSHQVWQGKVYTRKELEEICGLGTAGGLCGANCRHSYYPFIPGISERTYTDEELKQWAEEENTPKKYGEKEYTAYEASQEQRRLERLMRKQRQDIRLLKEGGANEEDLITAQAKYKITSDEYVKFSEVMNLPEQRARIYQDGLTGKFGNSKAYKIIENRANVYYNGDIQAYLKDEIIRKNIRNNADYNKIHWGKQDKHIKKTNNYIENRNYFTIDKKEIEEIALKSKGTGYIYRKDSDNSFNNKEKVVLEKMVGHYINYDQNTKEIIEEYDTNSIIIHYSKKGIHIIPGGR
ncbi:MAG: minor capsid protein [Clostridia bacterium]|nr:minor capsid protein [Clostridia bacterium]